MELDLYLVVWVRGNVVQQMEGCVENDAYVEIAKEICGDDNNY